MQENGTAITDGMRCQVSTFGAPPADLQIIRTTTPQEPSRDQLFSRTSLAFIQRSSMGLQGSIIEKPCMHRSASSSVEYKAAESLRLFSS